MNTSMRTFSDSGNQFLHSLRERFYSFQRLFACYLLPLRTLDLNSVDLSLLLQWLHLSPSSCTLHPVACLHQESFARAYSRVRPGLNAYNDNMIVTVAFVRGGVVAQDVLLRQVRGYLCKGAVKIF